MVFKKQSLFVVGIILYALIFSGGAKLEAATSKISLDPNPLSLSEGASHTVTVSLAEPIIAEEEEGYITLNFTSSNPHIAVSPSAINFTSSTWESNPTFSVSVETDGKEGNYSGTLHATAISNSEYYSGFSLSLVVNVTNTDAVSTPAPSIVPISDPISASTTSSTPVPATVSTSKTAVKTTPTPTPTPSSTPTPLPTETPIEPVATLIETPTSSQLAAVSPISTTTSDVEKKTQTTPNKKKLLGLLLLLISAGGFFWLVRGFKKN